jgi:1,4-alpha-glucan branching enzyme
MKKQYSKDRKTCRVTFKLPKEAVKDAKTVHLVGEFNNWNIKTAPLKKMKDGAFQVTIQLEAGRSYQFRYLIDEKTWENDWNADRYVPSSFGASENSVVIV